MQGKYLRLWLVAVLLMGSFGLAGCFERKDDYSKQGVSILTNAAIRAEATKDGKWLSSLALGETVKLEGTPVKDPKDPNTEYIKVKLSDGATGYVNAWCLVRGAYVGVIQETSVKIYRRPDLLAESEQKLDLMSIVAVQEEKDDWLLVTGERKAKSGWIQKDAIRKDKDDVVTAVLLTKAIRKEKTITREIIEKIVADLPDPDNYFATKILEKFGPVDSEPETGFDEEPVTAADTEAEAAIER